MGGFFEMKKSRQAKSIARIRAERRSKKLCRDCDQPAVVKRIASTGKLKVLRHCEYHLAWHAARREK